MFLQQSVLKWVTLPFIKSKSKIIIIDAEYKQFYSVTNGIPKYGNEIIDLAH